MVFTALKLFLFFLLLSLIVSVFFIEHRLLFVCFRALAVHSTVSPLLHVRGTMASPSSRLFLDYTDVNVGSDYTCCICTNPMTEAVKSSACSHRIRSTCAKVYAPQYPLPAPSWFGSMTRLSAREFGKRFN